jgi:glycine betaine catabolism B
MKTEATLTAVLAQTPDTKTFRVRPDHRISFVPGQFFMLGIVGQLDGIKRPFTVSSSPTEKGYLEFTIKKTGLLTSAMHQLKAGARVSLAGPFGETLRFSEAVKRDVVFIGGGSGISPFVSSLWYAEKKKLPNKITMLYSSRTKHDIIFRRELARKWKNAKIIVTLTRETGRWNGERGRVSREMIEKYVQEPKKKIWYLCGPIELIESAREILRDMGIPDKMLRIEVWQIGRKPDAQKKSEVKR